MRPSSSPAPLAIRFGTLAADDEEVSPAGVGVAIATHRVGRLRAPCAMPKCAGPSRAGGVYGPSAPRNIASAAIFKFDLTTLTTVVIVWLLTSGSLRLA